MNGFSIFSLKRNRSTSTNNNNNKSTKSSRLKSRFLIFSKLTDVIFNKNEVDSTNRDTNYQRTGSFLSLLRYIRNNDDIKLNKSEFVRKPTCESDVQFEYYHYHTQQFDNSNYNERNIHTLPAVQTKKLTGILIKRSINSMSIHSNCQQPICKESHILESKPSQASEITINSEDLTAKEFADMTGIRILPENVQDQDQLEYNQDKRRFSYQEDEEDSQVLTASTKYSTFNNGNPLSLASYTSLQSHSLCSNNKPNIWDNEFWQNPENQQVRIISRSNSTMTYRSIKSILKNNNINVKPKQNQAIDILEPIDEPPILNELRRMNTHKSERNMLDLNSSTNNYVIKKGRFEIYLGDNDPTIPNSASVDSGATLNSSSAN